MANQRKVAGGTTRLTQLIRIAIIAASAPMLWSEAALAEFNMSFIHGDENLSNAEAVAGRCFATGRLPIRHLRQPDSRSIIRMLLFVRLKAGRVSTLPES